MIMERNGTVIRNDIKMESQRVNMDIMAHKVLEQVLQELRVILLGYHSTENDSTDVKYSIHININARNSKLFIFYLFYRLFIYICIVDHSCQ